MEGPEGKALGVYTNTTAMIVTASRSATIRSALLEISQSYMAVSVLSSD
jgi:hypothetical protein